MAFLEQAGSTQSASSSIRGFTYAAHGDDGPMKTAKVGARVTIAGRRPPWIVVDPSLETVIIPSRWPGRLWHVEVVDPVTDADVDAAGGGRLRPDAGYTRAVSVDVLDEIPTSRLFGEHGEAVCAVISRSGALERDQVSLLGTARHPDADAAYSRAWNAWLEQRDPQSAHLGQNHFGVLGIGVGRSNGPIGYGFFVLYSEVKKRARLLVGPSAFVTVEEYGEEAEALEPAWALAADALLDAAMAFGAPGLVPPEDRRVLTAAWARVFGAEPGSGSGA